MARVIISREARNDLVSIRDYIRDELCNPDAARRILAELKKGISSLEHHPGRGKPLDALIAVHTEHRYLICENYCVFYVCMENAVLVVRVLRQRQDSFRALFLSE
jgi:toxin ParE1/3/4